MAKTLTIEVSDTIYTSLTQLATQIGQTPEQFILTWLESRVDLANKDPLLALAGVFEAPMTDISEQHDHYLGVNIQEDHA